MESSDEVPIADTGETMNEMKRMGIRILNQRIMRFNDTICVIRSNASIQVRIIPPDICILTVCSDVDTKFRVLEFQIPHRSGQHQMITRALIVFSRMEVMGIVNSFYKWDGF